MSRLKELEEKNRRLKKRYADSQMDNEILREAMAKKWLSHCNGSRWLNEHIFESPAHARQTATEWLWRYNTERPHIALEGITPKQKLLQAA